MFGAMVQQHNQQIFLQQGQQHLVLQLQMVTVV